MNAFRVCGIIGFVCACVVAGVVCGLRGASVGVEALLIVVAVSVFVGLALVTRRVLGREALIYYHHEIAVLCATAAFAALLGAPVGAHLDATALGLGSFLAWGRIGCLRVGCCHGRPARHGVVYGEQHRVPEYLVGLRLLPVQAFEAAAAAALVGLGAVLVALDAGPGSAAAAYVTGYAVVRFGLERLRGDILRPHWRGLSEAQWTGLTLCVVVCVLDTSPWHLAALAIIVLAAVATVLAPPAHPLAGSHAREVAAGLYTLPCSEAPAVRTARTSAGVRLSRGATLGAVHYSLSREGAPLEASEAEQLARLVLWLEHPEATGRLVAGPAGVTHVVVSSSIVAGS